MQYTSGGVVWVGMPQLMDINCSIQVWNEISISEEAESGQQVSSIIHVPSQASTYITSFLFSLCQEVGHVGGHVLDKEILQRLSGAVLKGVVRSYEELLRTLKSASRVVPQKCALQLLYNLKFVSGVLSPLKDEEVMSRYSGYLLPLTLFLL